MTDPNLPEIPSSEEKRPEPSVERSKPAIEKEATGAPFGTPGWERATLERLAFASLEEQRSARRWRNFVRLAWLLAFVVLGWTIFSRSAPSSDPSAPHTAVVEIRGEIDAGRESSAETVVLAMRGALEDKGSQALVLLINSPGGSPVQAGIINDEIVRLRALHKKPVYVVVEDTCASAAYYIAAAADQIYVDKASIVGSIGVLLNQIHQQFIAVVKKGRGTRLKETPEMFSGLFWTGQQAVEMGLADGFGTLDQVAREVVKAEDIIDYTRRENVAERLAKRFGAAVGAGAVQALRSAPPIR